MDTKLVTILVIYILFQHIINKKNINTTISL